MAAGSTSSLKERRRRAMVAEARQRHPIRPSTRSSRVRSTLVRAGAIMASARAMAGVMWVSHGRVRGRPLFVVVATLILAACATGTVHQSYEQALTFGNE